MDLIDFAKTIQPELDKHRSEERKMVLLNLADMIEYQSPDDKFPELILALLVRLHIPLKFVIEYKNGIFTPVTNKNELYYLIGFLRNKLPVETTEHGKFWFDNESRHIQRRLEESELTVIIVNDISLPLCQLAYN